MLRFATPTVSESDRKLPGESDKLENKKRIHVPHNIEKDIEKNARKKVFGLSGQKSLVLETNCIPYIAYCIPYTI